MPKQPYLQTITSQRDQKCNQLLAWLKERSMSQLYYHNGSRRTQNSTFRTGVIQTPTQSHKKRKIWHNVLDLHSYKHKCASLTKRLMRPKYKLRAPTTFQCTPPNAFQATINTKGGRSEKMLGFRSQRRTLQE